MKGLKPRGFKSFYYFYIMDPLLNLDAKYLSEIMLGVLLPLTDLLSGFEIAGGISSCSNAINNF